MYDHIKGTPEIDMEEIAEKLIRGEDEDFHNLILEIAYKIRMKTLQPRF